jgi:hypothetical protein
MRRARLLVTPQLFVDLLKGTDPRTFGVVSNPLPDDARVVDVVYINSQGVVALEIESTEFNDVPDGKNSPFVTTPECHVVEPEPGETELADVP